MITQRIGMWIALAGAVLAVLGAVWPTDGTSQQQAQISSTVALLRPKALNPPATSVTMTVPKGAVAGWVPQRDAEAFAEGLQWTELNGRSAEDHVGEQSTDLSRAAARDLMRGSGPVPAGAQFRWSSGSAAETAGDGQAAEDPVVMVVGDESLGALTVSWDHRKSRGNPFALGIGVFLLATGALLYVLSSRLAGRPSDPDSPFQRDEVTLPFRRRQGQPEQDVEGTVQRTRPPVIIAMIGLITLGAAAGCSGSDAASGSPATGSSPAVGSVAPAASSAGSAAAIPSVDTRTDAWGYSGVDKQQAERIAASVDRQLEAAKADGTLATVGERLTGPARDVFTARGAKAPADAAQLGASGTLTAQWLALPVATSWPRWFAAAGSTKASTTPTLRVLASEAAATPYGLWADLQMVPGATLPKVGTDGAGADVLPADQPGLAMTPQDVVIRYADVLNRGTKSDYTSAFAPDIFREQVTARLGADRKRIMTTAVATLASTHTPSTKHPPLAIRTADGGALVVVTIDHEYRATIAPGRGTVRVDPELAALAGREEFAKELLRQSVEVLAFVVPATSGQASLVAAAKADVSATGS